MYHYIKRKWGKNPVLQPALISSVLGEVKRLLCTGLFTFFLSTKDMQLSCVFKKKKCILPFRHLPTLSYYTA